MLESGLRRLSNRGPDGCRSELPDASRTNPSFGARFSAAISERIAFLALKEQIEHLMLLNMRSQAAQKKNSVRLIRANTSLKIAGPDMHEEASPFP